MQRTADAQLASHLTAFFTYVQKVAAGDAFRLAAERDLTLPQLRALFMLDGSGREWSVGDLAGTMGLSIGAASRAVDGLLRMGLVTRHEDEHDRRVRRIGLADEGRTLVADVARARRAAMAEFVESLSDDERERLAAALEPLIERPAIRACRPAEEETADDR